MKKVIRLTERDLTRIVKRTIMEMEETDKEKIKQRIINGKQAKPQHSYEYTADDAIAELEDYVNSNIGIGKNQLLRDMERLADSASRELSDEEYEKFMEYYDDLENQIYQELLDDEDDDEYNYRVKGIKGNEDYFAWMGKDDDDDD